LFLILKQQHRFGEQEQDILEKHYQPQVDGDYSENLFSLVTNE
jgi:hypothetical protein